MVPSRRPRHLAGLVLFLLAMLGQISGAVAPGLPDARPFAGPGVLCHGGAPAEPPAHHHGDCALCPICVSLGAAVALLAPPPMIPMPLTVAMAPAVTLPPARAPPSRGTLTAYPRGPPVLI